MCTLDGPLLNNSRGKLKTGIAVGATVVINLRRADWALLV